MNARYCEDCRWCKIPESGEKKYAKCVAPSNPVTGSLVFRGDEGKYVIEYCATLRNSGDAINCGPQARWFEPKLAIVA